MSELEWQKRRTRPYSIKIYFCRCLWGVGKLGFKSVPRPFFEVRNYILRLFGASIGKNVRIHGSVNIYFPWNLQVDDYASIGEWVTLYNLSKIEIGRGTVISHKAHLCSATHDLTLPGRPLLLRPIKIHKDVWICTDAYLGPGVEVCSNSIVGARAVITKDLPSNHIAVGNPAHCFPRTFDSKEN